MQAVQRCNCSVRVLESFVRDFTGLEMRQYRPSLYRQLRIASNSARSFGSISAFRMQQSSSQRNLPNPTTTSTAQDVEDALESVSAPASQNDLDTVLATKETTSSAIRSDNLPAITLDSVLLSPHDDAVLPLEYPTERLDILGSAKSREEGRKERKLRRIEARKAAEEEAKRQIQEAKEAIVAAKKKQRREAAKKLAAKATPPPQLTKSKPQEAEASSGEYKRLPRDPWMVQKAALQDKFGEQKWQPRKRISPDALSGIRTMHNQQPQIYTTEVLADHFKVSAEAIRRILKSKWQPDEDASEDRRKRWEKRGEKKWRDMVELGIRPPKKWREMGVGKVGAGEVPSWKKGGERKGAGERWIEHPEADSFVVAGDMASEGADMSPSIAERIL